MTETLHLLIERYGLLAVFAGCLVEGESAAVLAGFFTHQHVFPAAGALAATFFGAFIGDTAIFLAGRHFSSHARVRRLTKRPGFSRALALVDRRPFAYVMLNRYIYGFRAVGGIAAGLSSIPTATFLALNALSSAVWATLFLGIGYTFGVGAEQFIGGELARHQHILIGLALAGTVATVAGIVAHRRARR